MKNWQVELTAKGKSTTEEKIQRGIFQGDVLSLLLFVIAMMLFNRIHGKCTGSYKLTNLLVKIDHLMYMDNIKLFAKNEKGLKTLIRAMRIYNENIGMWFAIEKCTILIMRGGKRQKTEGIIMSCG